MYTSLPRSVRIRFQHVHHHYLLHRYPKRSFLVSSDFSAANRSMFHFLCFVCFYSSSKKASINYLYRVIALICSLLFSRLQMLIRCTCRHVFEVQNMGTCSKVLQSLYLLWWIEFFLSVERCTLWINQTSSSVSIFLFPFFAARLFFFQHFSPGGACESRLTTN